MSISVAPAIFDVFNARQLKPEDVASTFVPPTQFIKLVQPRHSLILGPRGSGKTTLLKMLDPAAIEAWEHDNSTAVRTTINYTGVFVGTDLNWHEQVKALGGGNLDTQTHLLFEKAAFTTRILSALVSAIARRLGMRGPARVTEHRRVNMTIEKERSFSTQLAAAWRFTKVAPSIDGLQNALDHRLVDLDIIASEEGARGQVDRSSRIAAISWLHLDFLSAAAVAVKLFNRYVNEHGARWALLFDELELAPRWQQELLLRYLRSVDEHFLFKLSMSPFEAGNTADHYDQTGLPTRQSRQDYDRIRLWYVNKTESFPFCRELLSTMLRQRNLTNLAAEDVFGHARLRSDPDDDSQLTVYRSNSSTGKLFKRLAARDPTFRDFLRRRDVDLGNLEAVSGIPRAANLRKGISIIALREYFKGEGREMAEERRTQRRRSRKVPTVYAGTESLFAMVEGNPRWFKGIVGQLLQGVTAQSPRVSGAAQVREVLNAVHVFRAMLRTVPVSTQQRKTRGLLSILDPIGNYFSKASIDAPFNPDPPASVTVDSRTDDETLRSLGIALDAGAIVYVDDDEGILGPNGLRGKRIRLAYLLAPYYHSPLRLGPPIALSTILNAKDDVPLEPPHVFDDALLWERT